uniref:CXXC-type zinc finger protein 1 n=1 Tax=Schistosoma mansoni TaxID=6183 RepID=A0A3Q0KQ35_SCHMA
MSQKYNHEKNLPNRREFSCEWDDSAADTKSFSQNIPRDKFLKGSSHQSDLSKSYKESVFSGNWSATNRVSSNGHEICDDLDDSNVEGLVSDDDNDFDEDDDEEDEDWVASDYEKKRSSRASRTQITGSRKIGNSCSSHRKISHGDRSQRRIGRSLSRTVAYNPGSSRIVSSNKSSKSVGRPKTVNRYQGGSARTVHTSSGRKIATRRVEKSKTNNSDPRKVFDSLIPNELKKPRQCFGPGCTRAAARPDTKYCSNECGLKLAIKRLETLLPESFHAWYPDLFTKAGKALSDLERLPDCMATVIDKLRLKEISKEQCVVHNRLVELEMEHQKLTGLISRAQERKTGRNNEQMLAAVAHDAEQVEQMEPIICVTCSAEISMRHALKHMEKCFQKMEGNTVFCANQKEQIMGTPLFCDAYDSQARAYCKRLRVVCEHYKEPKLPADTVCGSPLVHNVFEETGEFCCVPRNKCTKHFGWERLRRAKIDLERYRCLIQMDELMQEEQKLRRAISQRGGVLGILLHQTIDHNPEKPVPIPGELKTSLKNNDRSDT